MEAHERIRLETISGEVIAYLAPNAEVNRSFDDELTVEGLPGRDSAALVLDFNQWTTEITVQGFFESSAGLPEAHKTDLEELFGFAPVTAKDQFNRLISMTAYGGGGPYRLFNEGDDYAATTQGEIDINPTSAGEDAVYPAVSIQQIRPALNSGETREAYTIQCAVGVEG